MPEPDLTQLEQVDQVAQMTMSDVISPYILVFFVAWLAAIVTTPLMRRLAVWRGIVDWPDAARKKHIEPVAYLGGAAIFIGWIVGILAYLWLPRLPQRFEVAGFNFPTEIIAGAIIILITGLIDDIYGLSPRVKVGGQLFAAAMVAQTDIGTRLVGDSFTALDIQSFDQLNYWLGMLVIAVFIVGGCNAMNLLDGLDGLAAGVSAIACMGFLVIACFIAVQLTDPETAAKTTDRLANPVRVVMCLALLGALLGFLPHNFSPATIFMGDTGSMLLGYLCATTMLLFAHAPKAGPVMVTAAVIVFALPITDTALTIFRRVMARQPISAGDNHHMHHLFLHAYERLRCGPRLSVKLSVLSMYGLSLIFAALGCGLVLAFTRWRFVMGVLVVFFGFVVVAGYKSGHQQALLLKMPEDKAEAADNADAAAASTTAAEAEATPTPPDAASPPAEPVADADATGHISV